MKDQDLIRPNNFDGDTVKRLDEVLNGFIEINNCINQKNKQTSYLFNPLLFFDIGETKNSFLLAKLLDPKGEHGQGGLFLESFLKKIFVDSDGKWIVVAEKGSIDITIKRKDPHSVIVIENKSHGAKDQKSQLYRYWYEEILKPYNENNCLNDNNSYKKTLGKNNSNYRLIYLTRKNHNEIGDDSLKKHPEIKGAGLPKQLEKEHIMTLTFEDFIYTWLNDCLKRLEQNNHRLSVFLEQYIELWKI